MKNILLTIAATLATAFVVAQPQRVNIIPLPVEAKAGQGVFTIPTELAMYHSTDLTPIALYLLENVHNTPIEQFVPIGKRVMPVGIDAVFQIYTDPNAGLPAEGYRLSVTPERITIVAADYGGAWNAIQTLLQLMPEGVCGGNSELITSIPCIEIVDYPAYAYRGMMLDVARTFAPVEEVLRYIDNMSRYKLNRFHWHLTDDEGWRIEIKSHPELAEKGGFRGGDSPVWSAYGKWGVRYGGYYTQQQIKEVVEYAKVRNIEIIPEIDLPGHSRAVANINTSILCPIHYNTITSGGYNLANVWCATREENYAILEDILSEVCELFPSDYIHIGGDEVNMSQWNRCPDCQALLKREGLTDGHQLEGYFLGRLAEILERNGKLPAVWNEATDGGNLSKTSRVHGWQNVKVANKVAEQGYGTVVMPAAFFYFDMKQSMDEPGHTWAGVVDDQKCYSFDPAKEGFSAAAIKNIVGFEAAFWSELYLANKNKFKNYLDYQTYPRLCALSEVCWTPTERRNWESYHKTLTEYHYPRLERLGIDFRAKKPVVKFIKKLTPEMKFTTSFETFRGENDISLIEHYGTDFGIQSTRTCRSGDWAMFTFTKPAQCSSMELITGYRYMERAQFWNGYVEVSYDGHSFEKVAELDEGRATINPKRPVKAVRIVCTTNYNGQDRTVIQCPVII